MYRMQRMMTGWALVAVMGLIGSWSTPAGAAGPTAEEIAKIEAAMPSKPVVKPAKPRKLLVFNLCKGFRHSSIPYWDKTLQIMGRKTGAFSVVVSDDLNMFKAENLKQFDAVCLNNTTHLPLDPTSTPELCKALMEFVKSGKGIVGIHAATDNFYKWPEAQEMMGGKFTGHPWGSGGTWAIKIDEPDHPLTAPFGGKGFKIRDEIYRTDPPLYSRDKQLVLMSLDMSDEATGSVRGLKPTDKDTGISWIKTWGKGRVFYCSLGHNHDVCWNRPVLEHYLAGIQFALGDLKVDTKPRGEVGKGSEMDKLLESVKSYDWGQSRLALTELEGIIRKAHGNAAEMATIEQKLLDVLGSAKRAGKQWICRQLSLIGTKRSVPVLAKLLTDAEMSDMARYALERISDPSVDEALRAALPKAKGKMKIGIVNSLGQRRDAKAVGALAALLKSSDEALATAAAAALGQIADGQALKALSAAKDTTKGKVRMVVLDSYLRCADKLAAEGKKLQALAIYKELQGKAMPKPIRTAALRGMLNVTKR